MNKAEKFWDNRAKNFDAQADAFDQIYKQNLERTKKRLTVDDIVLDYACGTGNMSLDLAEHVREIQAADISSQMIAAAKRKAGERGNENIHFAQSTIFEERYARESFDAILAFNILHLVEDASAVLKRINELLKPGALLISATPCLGEKPTLAGILLVLLSKTGFVPYLKLSKVSELKDLVADAQLQIVESEIHSGAPASYFIVAKKV